MDIQEIIKERLEILPKDISKAIQSADLISKFEKIADKHGLLLDQNGSLQTETILVMLGLEPTDDFIENIQRELDISRNEAVSISQDVNKEIFSTIRASLQSMQASESGVESEEESDVSDTTAIPQKSTIFTPERPPVGMGGSAIPKTNPEVTPSIDKDVVLKSIEDPEPVSETPMTDHLLTTPVNTSVEVEIKKPQEQIVTEGTKSTERKSDPYREDF